MSQEKEGTKLSNGSEKGVSAPPGFVSLTSFRMKRIRTPIEATGNSKDPSDDISGRCSRHRPWLLSHPTPQEPDTQLSDKLKHVTERFEDARKGVVEDAPVYYPTEEEFEDIVTYIAKIRSSAQPYGICRVVPPPSWNPPPVAEEKRIWEDSRFVTRVQRIDGVQVPNPNCEAGDVDRKRKRTSVGFGCDNGHARKSWDEETAVLLDAHRSQSPRGPEFTVETFKQHADDFKSRHFAKSETIKLNDSTTASQGKWELSIENIEGEYNRIVENPSEEIEVLCCDGLESRIFHSGFLTASKSSHHEIANSCWNLNNVPKLPGSLLSLESNHTSSILDPRVQLGMCFSTLHWGVEEHHLYALCYLHRGAHKIWYGVPSRDCLKLQAALRNLPADVFEKQQRLVKHLSPSALASEGIPVFRCIQNPGEFVIVFPGVYHSGFDCGFNFSETVNFAPLDWLPHGQNAVELYRDLGTKTSFSHDKLLLQAAFSAVRAQWELSLCRKNTSYNQFWKDACGNEGILTMVFKFRVKCEKMARQFLCSSSRKQRMDKSFDSSTKRECKICLYDLHFSAAGCPCSPDVYSCLNHAKQLCNSCAWPDKFFLVRDDISDLNLLVEALEGKLGSIYKYAKEKLGLSLSSVPKSSPMPAQPHPASPSISHKLMQRDQNSSFRAEIKALLRRSTVSKKTKAADEVTEPSTVLLVRSERNLASCGNKDPETCGSEPTKPSNRAERKLKIAADTVASTEDGYRSFPKLDLVLGASSDSLSDCNSDESDGDPDPLSDLS